MRTDFRFKGLMVPVFTPFNDDKKRTVNYDMIEKYGQYLKTKGMDAVMVHGMTGEVTTLTTDERMKLTEKWMEVGRKYDMKVFLNIGGTDLPEVYTLAEHAEKLKVDAVMVLPDLFYKPKTEEDLTMYLKDIAKRMPTRPMFYYHIPLMTDVRLDLLRMLRLVERDIPMFAGLYYAHDYIDRVMLLKEKLPHFNYIIGTGTSIEGHLVQGFEAISMIAMNICPELIKDIYERLKEFKLREALMTRDKMVKRIFDTIRVDTDFDFVEIMKKETSKTLNMGPLRKPKTTTYRY